MTDQERDEHYSLMKKYLDITTKVGSASDKLNNITKESFAKLCASKEGDVDLGFINWFGKKDDYDSIMEKLSSLIDRNKESLKTLKSMDVHKSTIVQMEYNGKIYVADSEELLEYFDKVFNYYDQYNQWRTEI